MITPRWLSRTMVIAMHYDQLQEHGGLPGLRDDNGLEAALARPMHRWTYGDGPDLAELAAAYGFALVTAHAFNDGNKRTAFLATYSFLALNGLELSSPEAEVVTVMLDLAGGKIDEDTFANWVRHRT